MRIETSRLIIKPLGAGNLDDYAAMMADPVVVEHLNKGIPWPRERASDYLSNLVKLQKEKGFTQYGVFDRVEESLLGHCGFMDVEGLIDIGWTYVAKAWGKGVGTEAARAVLAYGFETLEFDLVTARTDPANLGSVGVMRAAGMVEFDTFVKHPGSRVVEYRLTYDVWHHGV